MWGLGDYSALGSLLEPYARTLAVAVGVQPGMDVLDVAAGNGNFAIAAANAGAIVTATDLTPKMVELGRLRTGAANLNVEWREADAEALPFADEAFDLVASVFGAMFAPRPDRVAAELFRVVKRGGGGRDGELFQAGVPGKLRRPADEILKSASRRPRPGIAV